MSNEKDGGPAYPLLRSDRPGMTMRQYYAAHAPPVPDWFEPLKTPRPTPKDIGTVKRYRQMPDGSEFERPANEDDKEVVIVVDKWRKDNEIAAYFQWPFYYASRMLAMDADIASKEGA